MVMIHLIVLDIVGGGKATFVIENIVEIIYVYGTRVYTTNGKYTEVRESVDEITKRINQIVYGAKE